MYYIFEGAIIVLGAVFIITQMILPPLIGKPFFWIFKSKVAEMSKKEDQLADAKMDIELAEKEKEIRRVRGTSRRREM